MQSSEFVRQTLLTVHLIGLAFGLGGATVADFMFFKAVKMGDRITAETVERMRSISKVVWTGLGLLSLSGIGMFLQNTSSLLHSSGFIAKMIFVTILIVNGMFLNLYTTARLTTFNFSKIYTTRDAAWKARKLSFVFGAVSTVSWYATLCIAQFKDTVKLPVYGYLSIYAAVLVGAVAVSIYAEYFLHSRHAQGELTLDKLTSYVPPATLTPALPQQDGHTAPVNTPTAPITAESQTALVSAIEPVLPPAPTT